MLGTFRLDFVIEDLVIAEIKSSRQLSDPDEVQLLNYLRKSPYEIGFLLHFGPRRAFRRYIYSNERKL